MKNLGNEWRRILWHVYDSDIGFMACLKEKLTVVSDCKSLHIPIMTPMLGL